MKGTTKLRHRFGFKKKKQKQQQQQQQQQHLGFKKFESEYNTNFVLQEDDPQEGYSWGALLPPYDSGKNSDDNNNDNNNKDGDGGGDTTTTEQQQHGNHCNGNSRRVRFDMSHQQTLEQSCLHTLSEGRAKQHRSQ
jgi:hypothetical protein